MVNLYAEPTADPNEKAKGIGALYGCPGRRVFKDLTTIDPAATPVRGVWSGGGRFFVAAGPRYMELSSTGALVGSVRTIADDGAHSPVQFVANGTQLFIVSAGNAYLDNGAGPVLLTQATLTGFVNVTGIGTGAFVDWVSGDKFAPSMQTITILGITYTVAGFISDTRLTIFSNPGDETNSAYSATLPLTALTGTFLDGYFIVNHPSTRVFQISDINDGTNGGTYTWNSLDSGVKESAPDYIRSVLANDEQLFLFGTDTFEVWQDTGAASFPFQRINGATGHFGSISAWGPIALDGFVYFLGGNDQGQICAYVMNGFTPTRISTYAEESAWNNGLQPTNVISYCYLEEGHSFWVFHIGPQCWAYDTTTGAWHQRAAWNGSAFTTYPTYFHTYIAEFGAGKHLTGGLLDGTVYESSVNFYDDAGSNIAWQRALPYYYHNQGNRIYFNRMTLEMETGTAASTEPVIIRDYSDDRGNTFVNPQAAGIGAHNDFSKRVFWATGGSSRDRIWRFTGVGKEKVALVALDLDMVQGVN